MESQVKVKQIQKYSDSQGEHIVTESKLILLKNKKPPADVYVNNYGYHPIIISETEKVEVGDKVLFVNSICDVLRIDNHNRPIVILEGEESQLATWKKILALPEHFSDKHLQTIVDGKMKDGDKVLVKCNVKREKKYSSGTGFYHNFKIYYINLNQQNHITLFPVKQSLDEAVETFFEENSPISFDTQMRQYRYSEEQIEKAINYGAEWAKKNNY